MADFVRRRGGSHSSDGGRGRGGRGGRFGPAGRGGRGAYPIGIMHPIDSIDNSDYIHNICIVKIICLDSSARWNSHLSSIARDPPAPQPLSLPLTVQMAGGAAAAVDPAAVGGARRRTVLPRSPSPSARSSATSGGSSSAPASTSGRRRTSRSAFKYVQPQREHIMDATITFS